MTFTFLTMSESVIVSKAEGLCADPLIAGLIDTIHRLRGEVKHYSTLRPQRISEVSDTYLLEELTTDLIDWNQSAPSDSSKSRYFDIRITAPRFPKSDPLNILIANISIRPRIRDSPSEYDENPDSDPDPTRPSIRVQTIFTKGKPRIKVFMYTGAQLDKVTEVQIDFELNSIVVRSCVGADMDQIDSCET
jgi:hypothetical protein